MKYRTFVRMPDETRQTDAMAMGAALIDLGVFLDANGISVNKIIVSSLQDPGGVYQVSDELIRVLHTAFAMRELGVPLLPETQPYVQRAIDMICIAIRDHFEPHAHAPKLPRWALSHRS
jgi:hypothetical protein